MIYFVDADTRRAVGAGNAAARDSAVGYHKRNICTKEYSASPHTRQERIIPSSARSRYIREPLTTVFLLRKNTRPFLQRCDTASVPCIEGSSPRDLQRAREREVPRAGIMRVSYHKVCRRRRALCPHKELQSAFISFKEKTACPFFDFRLIRAH